MGNCQSDYHSHHVRIEDPAVRKLGPSIRKSTKIVISYEGQNEILLDHALDPSMPLSPDATTLTTISSFSTPLDPYESPSPFQPPKASRDDGSETTLLSPSGVRALDVSPLPSVSSLSSKRSRKHKLSSKWNRYEQTRRNLSSALRARLERSTFTPASTVSSGNNETYQDSEIPFFSWDDCETNLTSRFSEESQGAKESKGISDDKANLWAEIETVEPVTAVAVFRHAWDRSRTHLAVVSKNGSIVVNEILAPGDDSHSDRLVSIFTIDHKTRIRSIDFSSDGSLLAVGGDDCSCTLYHLVYEDEQLCGASPLTKIDRVDRVCAVQFNPHQPLLAIGGFDGKVAILSTEKLDQGKERKVLNEVNLDGLVFALDWCPDGRYLACGGSSKKCTILDASDSWKIKAEIIRSGPVHSVKWSPANKGDLAIGSSDTAIFDINKMSIKHNIALTTKTISVRNFNRRYTLCWSPSGNYLIRGDSLGECTLFETKTYANVHEIHRAGSIDTICWAQSDVDCRAGNEFLITGGEDKKVAVMKAGNDISKTKANYQHSVEWVFNEHAFKEIGELDEADSKPLVKAITSKVVAITFSKGSVSRSSSFMAYATDDNQVTVLSTSDWSLPITALAFTHGSKYLAYGCLDSRLYVSETFPNWSLVANVELPSPVHNSLIYSESNRLLGAGMYDGNFILFDPEKKHTICGSIKGNWSPITCVDWSSKTIAVGKEDGTVTLYAAENVQSGCFEELATITKRHAIRTVAFGLSGRFLAIGISDGLVGIYSEKGGWVLCHQLQSSKCGVTSMSWSPTSRYLAVGDDQGSVKILDTVFWADVEEARQTFNHPDETSLSSSRSALTFSQDGKLLAFATRNNGVRVADCSNWRLKFCLEQADDSDAGFTSAEI